MPPNNGRGWQQLARDGCILVFGILLGSQFLHVSFSSNADGCDCNQSTQHWGRSRKRSGSPSVRDQQIFAEMVVHPGMITAMPPDTVAIVLADDAAVSSQVICEVLKHQTVNRVLLFPPPNPTTASAASSKVTGFSASWACADDSRVAEMQWGSPATSECDSVVRDRNSNSCLVHAC